MKTSKIITTLTILNLVLFMSVSSIAKPFTNYEGDIIKSHAKQQIEAVKSTISEIAVPASFEDEYSHLRFDLNKFSTESSIAELPLNSFDYLRFDASKFNDEILSEITELPSMNEFEYLRFDATNFGSTSEISEMPANEFRYLQFDVNKLRNETSAAIDELPAN